MKGAHLFDRSSAPFVAANLCTPALKDGGMRKDHCNHRRRNVCVEFSFVFGGGDAESRWRIILSGGVKGCCVMSGGTAFIFRYSFVSCYEI
ncbi:hypothetical protein CEXT_221171 [Caerostris extrusa]|uniref:Uncharacterized protein n=1 Tax=Caerostris extrusa TaxID=172846 RepID=A0AAV4MF17_CAEEX|nr:hypothetical protein CEXT_221171 [Caerostris extrusa]